MKKPVIMTCPYCHSKDVMRDGVTHWDFKKQAWVLVDTYDSMACNACDREIKECEEVPVSGYKGPRFKVAQS